MIKTFLLITIILLTQLLYGQSTEMNAGKIKPLQVNTLDHETMRPSYPFPYFLSTGPYWWYKDAGELPTKGHAFRISTFVEDKYNGIFIEKINFGFDGCCLEIVEFRELKLDEAFFQKHFPHNKGNLQFKLTRWVSHEVLEFNAYGGDYYLSNIGDKNPTLTEIQPR